MRYRIFKLTHSVDANSCLYQLMVYKTVSGKEFENNLLKVKTDVQQASLMVEVADPILHITEVEYLINFKACLKDYIRWNSTIREDQIVSNLQFVLRGYQDRVTMYGASEHNKPIDLNSSLLLAGKKWVCYNEAGFNNPGIKTLLGNDFIKSQL